MPYTDLATQRAYQNHWKAERRREWMEGKSCVRCGSQDRLEVDHVDPSTKLDHKVWTWSKEKRLAELSKCQVLCHDCHQQKSDSEQRKAEHGNSKMYNRWGCRCDLCRAWKRERNALRS